MVSAAAKKLNASPHTLADLKRFAKASPKQAAAYLEQVATNLKAQHKASQAAVIGRLLKAKTGTLVERIAEHAQKLEVVFPARAAAWGDVQQKRGATVGYDITKPDLAAPNFMTGKISKGKDGYAVFKTTGGQELKLNTSNLRVQDTGLNVQWVAGLLGDGPLSLQGTPSEDRKSFNLEGFALNTDGKFDTFTYGRVRSDGSAKISTPRGDVTIENPTLLKKMKAMPRLGVILPGTPELRGKELVYTGNPEEFFALARFRETAPRGTGATRTANVDMAYSVFNSKPMDMPEKYAARANHIGRLWVRGNVELNAAGAGEKFVASYVSNRTDLGGVALGETAQNADAVQAAVMDDFV